LFLKQKNIFFGFILFILNILDKIKQDFSAFQTKEVAQFYSPLTM